MPASPPTNVIHVVMHDVARRHARTLARRRRRSAAVEPAGAAPRLLGARELEPRTITARRAPAVAGCRARVDATPATLGGAGVAVLVLGPLCGLGCFCCGAWLYLRTRGEARRARRHERMLEREHLQESPSGRPHEELGTEL